MWNNAVENLRGLLVVFSLLLPFYLYRRAQKQRAEDAAFSAKHHCLPPPQLKFRWPLGLDLIWAAFEHQRANTVMQFFVDIMDRTGYTFKQTLIGMTSIGTIDPKNLEAVLATQFHKFGLGDRPQVLGPLLGNGIFTQQGEHWQHSRDLLRPLFLSNRVDNFLQIQDAVERLISCITPSEVVDFQPLFFGFTMDTTTYLLFGRSINSLGVESPLSEAFSDSFRIAQDYLARRGRIGPLHWLIGGEEFKRTCATVHNFVDSTIKDALAEHNLKRMPTAEKPGLDFGFLGMLIQETQDPLVLRDQLLNVLLAGRDTTACCLTWAMRLLAKHRNVLFKLYKEIETTVGVGSEARYPNRTDLKKMLYLTLVLKEVLRLYPSVPCNSRAALETTVLPTGGGPDGTSPIMVRKGEAVGYSVYVMHRRKDLYGSDAEIFRPERWDPNEDNDVDLSNIGWGYLPFNGGPRACLGQEFGLLEASYTIVRLLQTFKDFEYDPREEIVEVGHERQEVTLVLSSSDGCHIRAGQLQ